MASLTYNNVCLPYVDVIGFDCQAVYDDESRTDQILTRFDIKVQCVVSDDSLDLIDPTLTVLKDAFGHVSPADIISAVHDKLMEPRQELSFQFSGVEFIPGKAGVNGAVDAWNGPKPQGFTPIRMEPGSWLLLYHITAHYRVNAQRTADDGAITYTNLPGNVCLYNRWRETVEIDDREYTKRVRSGKFMIRSDNREGYVADQARSLMAQVGVPEGFVRNRRRYTVSQDGLSLQYEVEDQEKWMMPPAGAYRAQGKYHEHTIKGDAKRIGTCRVTLWGRKGFPRGVQGPRGANSSYADMIGTCCALVVTKLQLQGANFFGDLKPGDRGTRGFMLGSDLEVDMWDNVVTFTMSVLYPASGRLLRGTAFGHPNLPKTPGNVTGTTPQVPYTDRGSASLLLRAAAYYDPDLAGTKIQGAAGNDRSDDNPFTPYGGSALSAGKEPGQAGRNP